jgi:TctA family transporter
LTTMIGEANDVTVFFRRPVSSCLLIISIGLLLMPFLRRIWTGRKESARAS